MKQMKMAVTAVLLFLGSAAISQLDYTFTNCGATGQFGPSGADATAEYAGTSLEGDVSVVDGIQYWTVPATSVYGIEVYGAQGGDVGGLGARMYGEFELTAGTVLKILVGQEGQTNDGLHGSGGGGTFVVLADDNTPLIIAGGGGGHGKGSPGIDESSNGWINEEGRDSETTPGGAFGGGGAAASGTVGGTATDDGGPSGGSTWSSGGGGLLTDGGTYASGSLHGGIAFVDGGIGGEPSPSGGDAPGGFGGGGGCGDRGAGGGGYSGGAGGTNNAVGGAGGGSYNDGDNQDNESGVRTGHGLAVITVLCNPITITASATEVCFGEELTLSGTSESGETVSWDMGVEDGVAFVPTSIGEITYTVSTTDDNDCETPITITVFELPETFGAVTADDGGAGIGEIDLLVIGGEPGYEFDWDNDGTGDFDDTEDLTGLTGGSYVVVARDENGCESEPQSFYVTDLAGIEDENSIGMEIYPNPTVGQLNIQSNGDEEITFFILNLTGKVVMSGSIMPNDLLTVDLSGFEAGTYFVQLPNETVKIIKQ
jgi:hypothetical protein